METPINNLASFDAQAVMMSSDMGAVSIAACVEMTTINGLARPPSAVPSA